MATENRYSFVYRRGVTSHNVPALVAGVKQMMEPYTYSNFRFRKQNCVKDLVAVAAPLDVAFLLQFSSSGTGTNLHIMRVPSGPTLLFKVVSYTTETQKYPLTTVPLTILNNFPDAPHCQIVSETFKNMFPSIDVSEQTEFDRIVVVNYRDGLVQVRHYQFKNLSGVDQGIYNLRQSLRANYQTIEQVIQNQTVDDKLVELGPRMDLQLLRILSGMQRGVLLYHGLKGTAGRDERALEQRAKRTAKLERRKQIADLKRMRARLAKEKEENEHRKQEEETRMQRQQLHGLMEADQAGVGELVDDQVRNADARLEAKKAKQRDYHEARRARERELRQQKRLERARSEAAGK